MAVARGRSRKRSAPRRMKKLIRLFEDEGGATALEYGLLVAAIAAVLIVVAYFAGSRVSNTFNTVSQHIS